MDALKEEMLAQEFAKECNTASKLDAARKWLASKPEGAALVFSGLRSAGFVEAEGDTLTLGTKPFNVFARMAGDAMPNPVDQSQLGDHGKEFMLCHNRPENDTDWDKEEKSGTASMAGPDEGEGGLPGHVFITTKDLRWDRFNVLVMGMEGTREEARKEAAAFLRRLEAAAQAYVANRGWDASKVGMYFHVYPLCSVLSLHLHIVNLARAGPALKVHAHKNLPLSAAIEVLEGGTS